MSSSHLDRNTKHVTRFKKYMQALIFQKSTIRAFVGAKFEIMSSKFSLPTKLFSIERIDEADNQSFPDFINLSIDKLLAQLAIEIAMLR